VQQLHELDVLAEHAAVLELDGDLEVALQHHVHVDRDVLGLERLGVVHALGQEVRDSEDADAHARQQLRRQVHHLDAKEAPGRLLGHHVLGGVQRLRGDVSDVAGDAPALPPELLVEDHELALAGHGEPLLVRHALAVVDLESLHCALRDARADQRHAAHQASSALARLAVHVDDVLLVCLQPRLHAVRECSHGLQRRGVMVLEWVSLHATIENIRIVAAAEFTAKVVHLVVILVVLIHVSLDFHARVAVHMLESRGRKAMNNDTRSNVCHV
jgi:hypothetical protein